MKDLKDDPQSQCLENIKKLGGTPCPAEKCIDASAYIQRICTCQPPFPNGCVPPITGCCTYNYASPVPVMGVSDLCYCCCCEVSSLTNISIDATDTKPINEIQPGDMIYVADGPELKNWGQRKIEFSSGVGTGSAGSPFIQLDFGTEGQNSGSIAATPSQVFLMADGKLKRADKLVPGADDLVQADGTTVPLVRMTLGFLIRGSHHISTGQAAATSMNGHLVLVNGVVCGDYSLQISNKSALFADNHHELPGFGTDAYIAANVNLAEITPHEAALVRRKDG